MKELIQLQKGINSAINVLYSDIQLVLNSEYATTGIAYSVSMSYNQILDIFDVAVRTNTAGTTTVLKEQYYNLVYPATFTSVDSLVQLLDNS